MLYAAKIAIVIGWASFIIFATRTFLPSPLPVSHEKTRNVFMILPEGWGYFTRNPREPVLQLYSLDGEREPVFVPNFSKRSLFGLRREGRRIGGEVDLVLRQIPQKAWVKTQQRLSFDMLPDSTVVVHSTVQEPRLCGDYLIQLEDRTPWAWAKSRDSVVMPSKVVHVRVVCE